MCKIIAIANQKGGVAKTTTTINLGVGLSKVGKRVMLIDADPQGHLTMGLGFPKNLRVTLKTMMENIIMGLEFDPREAILHHEEGIDVIPSNKLLSGMDMSLFTVEDREKVLKEYLELLENDYDYILIDCMPSLGMMTINALSAADSVLIPVQPQYYAADGLMELLKVVKGIHRDLILIYRLKGFCLQWIAVIIIIQREISRQYEMLMEQRLEFLIRRFQEQRLLPKLHQKVSVFFLIMQKEKVRTVIKHLSRRC